MSLQSVLDKIEEKVKAAAEDAQKFSTYVSQCTQAIEKISADKASTLQKIDAVTGYAQALADIKAHVTSLVDSATPSQ